MENSIIDGIIENLFHVLPLIHKKLLKIDLEGAKKDISRLHFAIMGMLDEFGTLPVSEIGKRLLIPKPQMTHLIDQLISLAIAERQPDTRDRRIIKIALTDKGKITLEECKGLMRSDIRQKLSCLKDEELAELSVSLAKLRDIGAKLG
jgi:DNA-binding MarR family transcriptional regulator